MNMEPTINRLERELDTWRKREQRFSKMFTPQLLESKAFKLEKLKHFQQLSLRYGSSSNQDEQFTLRLLKQARRNLEQDVYPNRWMRLFRRALSAISLLTAPAKMERQSANNILQLKSQLDEYGFGQAKSLLEKQAKLGLQTFALPLSYYVNNRERMDFKLHFTKESNEQYRLHHYEAVLATEGQPGKSVRRAFAMDTDMRFTAVQAANLLSGRSVMKEEEGQSCWMKLDLADADKDGNFRMKSFPPEFGYNLESELKRLQLKNGFEPVVEQLKNGDRVEVAMSKNNRSILVAADPQQRSLWIQTPSGEKLTIEALETGKSKRTTIHIPLGLKEVVHQQGRKNNKGIKR